MSHAADAIVHTVDGRTLTGTLISETETSVTIEYGGVESILPRAQVANIHVVLSPEEAFAERYNATPKDNLSDRVDLIAEMIQAGVLKPIPQYIQTLSQDFPDSPFPDALQQLYQTTLKAQALDLDSKLPEPAQPAKRESFLLSSDQINLIRLGERDLSYELQADQAANQTDANSSLNIEGDPNLRIVVPVAVLTQVFNEYNHLPNVPKQRDEQIALRQSDGWTQLKLLESINEPSLLSQVRVIGDPASLQTFRQSINTGYIWRYFGRQFGKGQVPGLKLAQRRANAVPEAYTNFAQLSVFEVDSVKMINRLEPQRSLLVQWGLPRELAEYQAPEIEGWRPYFDSFEDPKFKQVVNWIRTLNPSPRYLGQLTLPTD